MGSAQCFLGSPSRQGRAGAEEKDWSSYLFTPEFLYFHSLLMGLQVAQQQWKGKKVAKYFVFLFVISHNY